jgi:hypothetical protein
MYGLARQFLHARKHRRVDRRRAEFGHQTIVIKRLIRRRRGVRVHTAATCGRGLHSVLMPAFRALHRCRRRRSSSRGSSSIGRGGSSGRAVSSGASGLIGGRALRCVCGLLPIAGGSAVLILLILFLWLLFLFLLLLLRILFRRTPRGTCVSGRTAGRRAHFVLRMQ